MCDKCFNKEYSKFNSDDEFETFLNEFNNRITKSMHFIKQERYKTDNHTVYACKGCKSLWWLSDPDNHWHGYFLNAENAKRLIDRDEQQGKILKYGCLSVLILGIGLVLFKMIF